MKFNAHLTAARSEAEARERLAATGCTPEGLAKMALKLRHYAIKLEGVSSPAANILKQEMLSLGGEAAIQREALVEPKAKGNVILMGTVRQLRELSRKLKPQPFGLKALAEDLPQLLKNLEQTSESIRNELDANRPASLLAAVKGELDPAREQSLMGSIKHVVSHMNDVAEKIVDVAQNIRGQTDPNSAGSQFFICLDRQSFLDGKYTAFGQVTEGQQVVDAIGIVPTSPADKPLKDVIMKKVYIELQ